MRVRSRKRGERGRELKFCADVKRKRLVVVVVIAVVAVERASGTNAAPVLALCTMSHLVIGHTVSRRTIGPNVNVRPSPNLTSIIMRSSARGEKGHLNSVLHVRLNKIRQRWIRYAHSISGRTRYGAMDMISDRTTSNHNICTIYKC